MHENLIETQNFQTQHSRTTNSSSMMPKKAVAQATITMMPETLQLMLNGTLNLEDIFTTARIAGIQAAKKCSDLIPSYHAFPSTQINVALFPNPDKNSVIVQSKCQINPITGAEMEAMTAVSVAALTVYDMSKHVDSTMVLNGIHVIEDHGMETQKSTLDS